MKICVVGLGYVGLPLAVEFGKYEKVNAFDINEKRVQDLKNNIDITNETSAQDLLESKVNYTSNPKIISESDFIIVAVPTPIDEYKNPDLSPLIGASTFVGKYLKKDSIVVYESTVYPGCTERDCVPILEKESGLEHITNFKVGYSPERINPGDKKHTLSNIVKVVSGCDKKTLDIIANQYSKIIKAGIHKASSIKVAEASKIIENTQRDLNIALMNELKIIFDKEGINYSDVLEAAGTKWNFLNFYPGLVGGHCIGVDPYYLAHESKRLGHIPNVILSGRAINDNMAVYEANKFIKWKNQNMSDKKRIIVLGGTFKENVPDTRNSKVKDFIKEIKEFGCEVLICEPNVKGDLFGCENIDISNKQESDLIVKLVNHDQFKDVKTDYDLFNN